MPKFNASVKDRVGKFVDKLKHSQLGWLHSRMRLISPKLLKIGIRVLF